MGQEACPLQTVHLRPGPDPIRRALPLILASLLAIAVATLRPDPAEIASAARTPLWCVPCGTLGMRDVVLNVLLFLPFGLGLGMAGWRPRRAAAAGALVSLGVEAAQHLLLPGRDASLSDLLTNTAGTALGAALWPLLPRLLRPGARDARRLLGAAAALPLLFALLDGWALAPAVPGDTWFGMRAPRLAHLAPFEGTVLDATLDGRPVMTGVLAEADSARASLAAGTVSVAAQVVTGPAAAGLAPIVAVFTGRKQEVMLLGQDGDRLAFRFRTHAYALKLPSGGFTLPGVFARPGDTLVVRATLDWPRVVLTAGPPGRAPRRQEYRTSVGWGWTHFVPMKRVVLRAAEHPWLHAAWMAGLFLPLGFLASALRSPRGVLLAGVVAVLTVDLLPLAAGLVPMDRLLWLGTMVGLLAGAVLARLVPDAPQAPSATPAQSRADATA